MQQLQIDFQKKKFKQQNVKQKNKKLIKQINRLRTELKNFRNEFLSKSDSEKKNKNDSMKSKKKSLKTNTFSSISSFLHSLMTRNFFMKIENSR